MSVAARWSICSCSHPSLRPTTPPPSPPLPLLSLRRKASALGGAGQLSAGGLLLRRHLVGGGRGGPFTCSAQKDADGQPKNGLKETLQIALWVMEGVYVVWLFFLPFAPVCCMLYSLFLLRTYSYCIITMHLK